ncbi:hypothetical protein AWRI1631_121180 [Saccharomyces cerevisiae AWRI1631]|uniref:Uncharacterized protein n=1 Tax=Saccharomyces cerevisiae (strain AWRI1631) TaxID=545124 RepID=B5VN05_YEAS6|nr:hypothetical protein AWRI1631_121180 [Saccharomyces cerevisiae AWRI1631]
MSNRVACATTSSLWVMRFVSLSIFLFNFIKYSRFNTKSTKIIMFTQLNLHLSLPISEISTSASGFDSGCTIVSSGAATFLGDPKDVTLGNGLSVSAFSLLNSTYFSTNSSTNFTKSLVALICPFLQLLSTIGLIQLDAFQSTQKLIFNMQPCPWSSHRNMYLVLVLKLVPLGTFGVLVILKTFMYLSQSQCKRISATSQFVDLGPTGKCSCLVYWNSL